MMKIAAIPRRRPCGKTVPHQTSVVVAPRKTPTGRKSWQRRKQARPEEILEAALGEFSRKGYSAARMEDIARLADITKGTIYLYFQNKEDLFKTLVHEMIGKDLAITAERVASSRETPKQKFADLLADMAIFFKEPVRIALLNIILSESSNFRELARLYRVEIVDRIALTLSNAIGDKAEQHGLRRLPAEQIAQLCVAPALLSTLWRSSFEHPEETTHDEKAVVATQLRVVFRGCLVGSDGTSDNLAGGPCDTEFANSRGVA